MVQNRDSTNILNSLTNQRRKPILRSDHRLYKTVGCQTISRKSILERAALSKFISLGRDVRSLLIKFQLIVLATTKLITS